MYEYQHVQSSSTLQFSPLASDGIAEPTANDVKHLPHPGRDAEPLHNVGLLRLGLERRHRVQQGVPEGDKEGATNSVGDWSSIS